MTTEQIMTMAEEGLEAEQASPRWTFNSYINTHEPTTNSLSLSERDLKITDYTEPVC